MHLRHERRETGTQNGESREILSEVERVGVMREHGNDTVQFFRGSLEILNCEQACALHTHAHTRSGLKNSGSHIGSVAPISSRTLSH